MRFYPQNMSSIAEDFILKFHSLEGTTVAQRRKNFFILLHQNALLRGNGPELDAISANLAPKTHLESLFKLEFLIYFQRVQELHQLLKEGNQAFVSKIVKQMWFFKQAFDDVGPDQLVNEVLPSMSFSVRMKVLRKLSRCVSCEQFDQIFDALMARYGIFVALNFIVACTPTRARQVIKEHPIRLTVVQLKIMYRKDRDFIEFYFDNGNYSLNDWAYRNLVKFLYCEDRPLFDRFQQKYEIKVQLGQRITKKLVKVEKENIVDNPSRYRFLHMKAVVRKLGRDSIKLFCNVLPSDFHKRFEIRKLLNWFSKKHHYNLYVKTFENHYNVKYVDYPSLIDEYLLRLIPENSEREVLAKVKVDTGDDDYIKYLTTDESVPRIKELINVTSSAYDRAKLVRHLIETCHINNDLDALTQVMKYFLQRHKNDEINVHTLFIDEINNRFGFKQFTGEMWKILNDLLTLQMLKFDEDQSTHEKFQTLQLQNFTKGTSVQKLSYLEFLFNKNEPVDELIAEYMSSTSEFPVWSAYGREFGKYFLLNVIRTNSREAYDKEHIDLNISLISQINEWNSCYEDDQMSFYDFPSLIHAFNHAVRTFSYIPSTVVRALKNKIFTTDDNPYRKDYLQVYWERLSKFATVKDFNWFIKYDPFSLVQNFDKFVSYMIHAVKEVNQIRTWHEIKKLSHLQLDTKSEQFCLSKMNDDACLDKKTEFIICLSVVMKPADFTCMADSYKPANKTLNLLDENQVRLYNLQCSIARLFKNTKNYEVLPSLLNYCVGDYFKYSLRSLYAILYSTPENMLPQYLNHLAKKAVSVRKHALYLTCELCTVTKVEDILKLLNKTEGAQSLQKCMFSATIQYFVKNPSDTFFEMVKSNMLFISKTDSESHRCIIDNVQRVPKKYRGAYVQCSWEFFEKTVDTMDKLLPLKTYLLKGMNAEVTEQLHLEFCLSIIKEHFLVDKEKSIDFHEMCNFAFLLLFWRQEKSLILDTILTTVEERGNVKIYFDFFHAWYPKVMSAEATDLKYLEPFVNHFDKKIRIVENFDDYVKIFFLKTKLEFPQNLSANDFSSRMFSFLDHLTSTYGPYVVRAISSQLEDVRYFTTGERTINRYCNDLIRKHPNSNVAILIMNIIHYERKQSDVFYDIVRQILAIRDPAVQINLHLKFKNYIAQLRDQESSLAVEVDDISEEPSGST